MGVVGPHHDSGRLTVALMQMRAQRSQRLEHVLVPQIPRRHPAPEHRAVVDLRVANGLCILLRIEQFVFGEKSVAARVLQPPRALQFDQLLDNLRLAGHPPRTERGGVPVCLTVVSAGVIEAGVALSRPLRRDRVDVVR